MLLLTYAAQIRSLRPSCLRGFSNPPPPGRRLLDGEGLALPPDRRVRGPRRRKVQRVRPRQMLFGIGGAQASDWEAKTCNPAMRGFSQQPLSQAYRKNWTLLRNVAFTHTMAR